MSYYTNQIKEVESAYDFLKPHYDFRSDFIWDEASRDLEEYNNIYLNFDDMTVGEAIAFLQDNCEPHELIITEGDGYDEPQDYYVERVKKINQTDEEYLDYIANSFDFKSEYNLSQSWLTTCLWYNDDTLNDMGEHLTQKRFDILKSFKNQELVKAEDIVYFLLDKNAFRRRVSNLYTYCDREWDPTDNEMKIADIKLEAYVTFGQLEIV